MGTKSHDGTRIPLFDIVNQYLPSEENGSLVECRNAVASRIAVTVHSHWTASSACIREADGKPGSSVFCQPRTLHAGSVFADDVPIVSGRQVVQQVRVEVFTDEATGPIRQQNLYPTDMVTPPRFAIHTQIDVQVA